jgi:hypothetical protein
MNVFTAKAQRRGEEEKKNIASLRPCGEIVLHKPQRRGEKKMFVPSFKRWQGRGLGIGRCQVFVLNSI